VAASISVVQAERAGDGHTIVLQPGRIVSGRIRSSAGKPVWGAELWFSYEEGTSSQERQAISAADGSYRIEGVLPGVYWLRANAKGFDSTQRRISAEQVDQTGIDLILVSDARRVE
jgi:hypothetical protein